MLDGTLIACDRVAGTTERGNDLWYSGKAKRFAENRRFTAASDGQLPRVPEVESGSVHALRAVRLPGLPALYAAARHGLPTLAGVGCTGAGIGVHTPFRPHPDILAPGGRQPDPQPAPARHPSPRRTRHRRTPRPAAWGLRARAAPSRGRGGR